MSDLSPDDVVIVSARRTPIGSFQGKLASLSAPTLGGLAISKALHASNISTETVDEVYMGNVLSAGLGQAPARQAALSAGIPVITPCTTISKVCGSGMKAIMLGADQIKLGNAECIVAGGMENMSLSPYLLPKARSGQRLGHGQMLDHMFFDGLQDAYCGKLMGEFADTNSKNDGITREQMDNYALESLSRAQTAITKGYFVEETFNIADPKNPSKVLIKEDEQPGSAKPEKIPRLKPAFGKEGLITAANASSISDGAAALVLMRADIAKDMNLAPLAKIVGHASVAGEPSQFTHAPINAIEKLKQTLSWDINEVDLFEINEAFAMVTLAAINQLNLDPAKVNVNGGACALGHPIGASGARIVVTLIHALKRTGGSKGIASLCIGGGEATALGIEML